MQTIDDLQSQIAALLDAAPVTTPRQRVPMSGLTNAVTGQDIFLEDHEYPAYMDLGAQYIEELRPVGVRETQLAQKIIDLNWRLNTLSAVENNLFHSARLALIAPHDPNDDKTVAMTSKAAVWRDDCENSNSFEKLGRHEMRVQRSLFRITAELERFQAIRLKKGADTFILEECKAWRWYSQMLALYGELAAARRAEAAQQSVSNPRGERHSLAATPQTRAAGASPFQPYGDESAAPQPRKPDKSPKAA